MTLAASERRAGIPLREPDFERLAERGFGDPGNSYAFSMAWFDDALYVGTVRNMLMLVQAAPPSRATRLRPWPVQSPQELYDADQRAQIWRWSAADERWTCVYVSPVIDGVDGEPVPRDLGYRKMAVAGAGLQVPPGLYVGSSSSSSRGIGSHVLRFDGTGGPAVSPPVLGDREITAVRSLIVYDGRISMCPTGRGRAWNAAARPSVYETTDPIEGEWRAVSEPHFGDPGNDAVYCLAEFRGRLYAGTLNPGAGLQVWRTTGRTRDGFAWRQIIDEGAGRGPLNEGVVSMCVFNDALYVGTGIANGGYDRSNDVGPAAGEILCIYGDDAWDLVVGRPRRVRGVLRRPRSGLGPGFDNPYAGYIWNMAVHDGWLYVSTFDALIFALWRDPETPVREPLPGASDRDVTELGGCELWRTRDGIAWEAVTRTGFGNPFNYGIRTLESTPHGLFAGTANPFGPRIATRQGGSWTYADNPYGGAEIWRGRAAS